jgi:predicted metalloprotease with PDZ domain
MPFSAPIVEPEYVLAPIGVKIEQDRPGELGFALGEKGTSLPIVSEVTPHGPADRAGMQVGDQVVSVNGIDIGSKSASEVLASAEAAADSKPAIIRVRRLRLLLPDPLS